MFWLAVLVGTSGPDVGGVISAALSRGVDLFAETLSINALMWTALGASFVVWISQLSLPQSRRGTADR
jgi:uncharacterized membrane protein YeaQ/YmgE (transglycosylase-associated protein family)